MIGWDICGESNKSKDVQGPNSVHWVLNLGSALTLADFHSP